MFQPVVSPTPNNLEVEWSVRHNIYREYLEELFRVPEVQHSMGAVDLMVLLSPPEPQVPPAATQYWHSGFDRRCVYLSSTELQAELCTLLLIKDEAWYEDQRSSRHPATADSLQYLNLNDEFMDHEHRSARPHVESVTTLPLYDNRWDRDSTAVADGSARRIRSCLGCA